MRKSRGSSRRWEYTRRRILERNGYRCRTCGRAGRLEVDHIKPISDGGDRWKDSNLQALCVGCHIRKTHEERLAKMPSQVAAWKRLLAATMEEIENESAAAGAAPSV